MIKPEVNRKFKTLNLIYVAILASLSIAAIFSVIMVFKSGAMPVFGTGDNDLIKSIVIIALLVGIPVSHIFFYKKVKHIDKSLPVLQKMAMYQTAFIVRVSMLEGIGLLALIGYLISADKSFLYMFGVIFILFIIHAPTRNKLSSDLDLTEEEEEEIL